VSLRLQRGVVVTVRFDPAEGREIRKSRPAVVVSNDAACRFDAVVQVVPVSGLPDRPLRRYESPVSRGSSGLGRASRLLANQLRTISKTRIGKRLGVVSPEEQQALDVALRIQLGLATA